MRSWLQMMLACLVIWASCPGQASAHLVNSGLGPFYDGVAHLLVTPEDILLVVALALLAGLGGERHARAVLFLLPLAWLAGAGVEGTIPAPARLPILNAGWLIALGVLVASDRRLPLPLVGGLAMTAGLVHGLSNGAALAAASTSRLAAIGTVTAVFVVVAFVAGQVVSLRREWARITVRVAGSWIGAIGLLMLGWAAR
jgi:hydrogenase/urease accessory protein HupE